MSIEIVIMSQQEDANCLIITAFSLSFPMLLHSFYIFPCVSSSISFIYLTSFVISPTPDTTLYKEVPDKERI